MIAFPRRYILKVQALLPRTVFLRGIPLLLLVALGLSGCAGFRAWSYGRPDVFLRDFTEPPVLERLGDGRYYIDFPLHSTRSDTWIVPRCRVVEGRALVSGHMFYEQHTGPFVIQIRKTRKVDPETIPFFWLDPDETETPLQVVAPPPPEPPAP